MRDLKNKIRNRRRGASMVEMAIVLPLLLIITLGIIEYGWMFYKISQVNMAARAGVRVAVRPDATDQEVAGAVASMMKDCGMKDYTLSHSDINVAVTTPVSVSVSVDFSKLSLTGTSLIPVPSKIAGKGVMSKEGPPPTTPTS
jgi:Flp pilus assembly protein TadG